MLVDTKIPLNDLKLVMEAFSYSLKGLKKKKKTNLNFEPTALCSGYHLLSTGRPRKGTYESLCFPGEPGDLQKGNQTHAMLNTTL